MIVIGTAQVHPHRDALDPATNSDAGSLRIEASIAEYRRHLGERVA